MVEQVALTMMNEKKKGKHKGVQNLKNSKDEEDESNNAKGLEINRVNSNLWGAGDIVTFGGTNDDSQQLSQSGRRLLCRPFQLFKYKALNTADLLFCALTRGQHAKKNSKRF